MAGGRASGVFGISIGGVPRRMPETESPCGIGLSRGSFFARLRSMIQASPSFLMLPPALADCRKGWLGIKSVGAERIALAGEISNRISPPSDWADILRERTCWGRVFLAAAKKSTSFGSATLLVETGKVSERDALSFLQLSLQICQVALAVRLIGFPTAIDAGAVMSVIKTGLPV